MRRRLSLASSITRWPFMSSLAIVLVSFFWEVSAEMAVGFQAKGAVVEIMKNDPEAVWLELPLPLPTSWPPSKKACCPIQRARC